jgi:hypothetical protein
MGWIMAADMRHRTSLPAPVRGIPVTGPAAEARAPDWGRESDVAGDGSMPEIARSVVELLDEAECLRLILVGGVGRIGLIEHAESKVAFEIDEISQATREGWSILVQGSAHPVDSEAERVSVMQSGVEAWAGGEKELFVRVVPTHITGRRIRRTGPPAAG